MTLAAAVSRFFRRYFYNQEALIFLILFVIVYNSLFHVKPIWRYFQRAKVRMQLKWNGSYDRVPNENTSDTKEQDGEAWELKNSDAAVYAIQGRRPHMEDRFNMITNLESTGASIYGIFDGHGGEFAADFAEKTLFKSVIIRLLKTSLDEAAENLTNMLNQEIMNVDNQLLNIARSNMDISELSTPAVFIPRPQISLTEESSCF